MPRPLLAWLVLVLVVVGVLAAACGDPRPVTIGPTPTICPSGIQPTFSSIDQQLIQPTCIACHNAEGAQFAGGLDMSGDAYAALVNVTAHNTEAEPGSRPAGLLRVKPGDPDDSLLYHKLLVGTTRSPQYGNGMPFDRPGSVCQQTIDAIRTWIATGAARD